VAFVRSPFARARIGEVDSDASRSLPGVHAVLVAADLTPDGEASQLARDLVCYVGDPIALVVAETRYLAEDACELVEVEYEQLDPVVDPASAATDTTNLVHPDKGTNVMSSIPPSMDDAMRDVFAGAAHVVRTEVAQHRHVPVPMETRGLVASWNPFASELTIWVSSQHPFGVRSTAATLLGVPEPRVRVVMKDVGGGFGQKIGIQRDMRAVLQAAHRLARPLKWIEDRWENLVAATSARADHATVTAAFDADARLLAVDVDVTEDVGAYGGGGGGLAARMFPGPYRLGRLSYASRSVSTNM
jgi:carbon-monoxide dehydrogenase large subunit